MCGCDSINDGEEEGSRANWEFLLVIMIVKGTSVLRTCGVNLNEHFHAQAQFVHLRYYYHLVTFMTKDASKSNLCRRCF